MTPDTIKAFQAHAELCYPRESCGVVLMFEGAEIYKPCHNIAEAEDHFAICPIDYANAEDMGEITHIVHSHPAVAPIPSEADRVGCTASGLPWVIVNWPTGNWAEYQPDGYVAPLLGREFAYGVLDCYTLIQDYYKRACGIRLPDFEHQAHFWKQGVPLYEMNYEQAGFYVVDTPQQHDMLILMVGATIANHGVIYLGNGTILHHLMNRLSTVDVYGGYFQKVTVKILRHKEIGTAPAITPEAACAL